MQNETITPQELRKIMKLSLTIDIELGFYISRTNSLIDVDRCKNWNPAHVKTYKFEPKDLPQIVALVNAYAKVLKRHFISVNGACGNKVRIY